MRTCLCGGCVQIYGLREFRFRQVYVRERTSEQKKKRDRQREIMLTESSGGKEEGKKIHGGISPVPTFSFFLSSHIYIFSCQWRHKESSRGFDELVTSVSFVKMKAAACLAETNQWGGRKMMDQT